MFVKRVITAIVLTVAVSVSAVQARSLRNLTPAEFPPSSYTGKQYVDSKGCIFVRSGFGGGTTWVPRVKRNRTAICGATPTFAKAPKPNAPVIADPRAAAPVRVAAAPTRKPVRTPRKPVGKPMATIASTIARPARVTPRAIVQTPPRPVAVRRTIIAPPVVSPPPPVAVRAPAPKRHQAACQGASAISNRYINSGARFPVRCGPQAISPVYGAPVVASIRSASPRALSPVSTAQTRTPIAVVENGQVVTRGVGAFGARPKRVVRFVTPVLAVPAPPKGYVKVWDDGRLNPNRGIGTLSGRAQMNLVWTETVPRRLIDKSRGIEVTRYYPAANYPVIPTYGYTLPASAAPTVAVARARIAPGATTRARKVAPAAKIATRVPRATGGKAATYRYVQVATFAGHKGANNAAARMQRLGYNVGIRAIKRGNRNVEIVLAGPFRSQSQLKSALRAARRSGYSSAALIK